MKKDNFSSNPAVRLYARREYQQCISAVDKQLPAQRDDFSRNYLMLVRGNAVLQLGQNQQAREIFFHIYRNCRLLDFKEEFADLSSRALLNAGLATKNMGDTKTAIQFYRQALSEGYIADPIDICRVQNMLGNALIMIDNEEAWERLQQALSLSIRHKLPRQRLLIQLNISDYYIRREEYGQANQLLLQELSSMQADKYPDIHFRYSFNLAALLHLQEKHAQAITALRKLLKLAPGDGDRARLLAYQGLSQHALGRQPAARRSLEEAKALAENLEMDNHFVETAFQQVMSDEPLRRELHLDLASTLFHRHGMIGVSARHHQLMNDIDSLADANNPLLVTGETGTGKELVARALHNASERRQKPFIPVNCPAIPETLFESILFGHRKGSFTGATEDRIGLVEAAADGTIFFDEFGDLPLSIQPKLLRFLESGEYTTMGSQQAKRSPARIISATNRDLDELTKSAQFRQDLLQRISVFRIHVSPLRNHIEDVYFLATGFLDSMNERYDTRKTLTAETILLLEKHSYQGNVRELKNLVLRGYQRARTLIEPHHLTLTAEAGTTAAPSSESGLEQAVADFERRLIETKLREHHGEREQSAQELGISLRSLKYKLQKLGIDSQTYKTQKDRKRQR
ncbi:MAG: sigma 54-interacting transcriptional regulator [Candidatus Delongbacteria bacterium]|nr:sigma 54-interacting transcriptional regulator [Candidatus Delongbacteria bacterium]